METNHQLKLLKALVNDIEHSSKDLEKTIICYRKLIIDILPVILRDDFNIPLDRIPSSLYLKQLCETVENDKKFEYLQNTRNYHGC